MILKAVFIIRIWTIHLAAAVNGRQSPSTHLLEIVATEIVSTWVGLSSIVSMLVRCAKSCGIIINTRIGKAAYLRIPKRLHLLPNPSATSQISGWLCLIREWYTYDSVAYLFCRAAVVRSRVAFLVSSDRGTFPGGFHQDSHHLLHRIVHGRWV